MFICKNCNTQVPSNTPSKQLVIKTRSKSYPKRIAANSFIDKGGKQKTSDDPGGTGIEIVKEIIVCSTCYEKLTPTVKPNT